MNRPSGVTEKLCRTILDTSFESLPKEAVEVAKRVMLDGIAVAIAGAREDGPRIAAEHIQSLGGIETSTLIGMGSRTTPVSAAFVNGISMHVLDFEPMWMPPTHAVSPSLPSILALAEMNQAPGREVITAFVKACEIQGRINLAGKKYEPGHLQHHPPGYLGVMGSAAGAGHLLGLNLDQLRHALGIAGSKASSLMANVGSMTKATHCGSSSSLGLEAAMLAKRGFTGNDSIFEAENGYADVYFGEDFDFDALLDFGRPYRMVDPGFALKLFPSQYSTHFAITAALELHSKIGNPGEIASVHILGPVMNYVNRPGPKTGLEGKFSFQYVAAAALLDGAVTIDTFTDARCRNKDISALLSRTTFTQSESIPAGMDKMHVEIKVEMKNGERLEARCDGPKDFWGAPKITREEHLEKIRNCLARRLNDPHAERLIQLAGAFDELSSEEVGELIEIAGCFENN